MSVALMWVAFFGFIQLLGWLFYWQAEPTVFPPAHGHARPTLRMDLPADKEAERSWSGLTLLDHDRRVAEVSVVLHTPLHVTGLAILQRRAAYRIAL